jgi:hypothetical protein
MVSMCFGVKKNPRTLTGRGFFYTLIKLYSSVHIVKNIHSFFNRGR